jgi:tetratricopeptide (TPR) repeat protein
MYSSVPSPFGDLFKAFRQRRHLTQQQVAAQSGVHRNTIGRWERGDVLPNSRAIVLELAKVLQLNDGESRQLLEASYTAFAPHWNVPYPRNPFFTGREEVLHSLHEHLHANQASALTRSYALQGLAGIGKTQTAVEYAYRHSQDYSAIFWIEAETAESITSSLVQIGALLQLPERQEADQQRMVAAVQRWLACHRDWLVIWDNMENVELLQRFLSPVQQGAIVLTTRCQALGTLAQGIELAPLTPEEGTLFLLRRAKVLAPIASPEQLQHVMEHTPGEYAAAQELVRALEGLPLALDQVGAYVEETGCSMASYLHSYEIHRQQLLERRGTLQGTHPASIAATLSLVYERVERAHPAAAELLCLCAFLYADEIPEELIVEGAAHLGPVLQPVAADPYQLDQAIAALRTFSLVQRQPETHMLSVHRLVQAVLKEQLEPASMRLWAERAVRAVHAAFPQVEFAAWPRCECYVPHAQVCRLLIDQVGIHTAEAAQVLQKAGAYLRDRGRYAEAKPFLEQALAIQEQQPEPDPLALATTLNHLGGLYWNLGKYGQAEPLQERALAIREQQLGPAHSHTAESLNDLAVLYWCQGKYGQAEPSWERALAIRDQQLGPDHPDTAESLINVGFAYRRQGKYEQAEPLLQRALLICEQQVGPDHPMTAVCLSNVGELHLKQGKYEQAEPLLQRSLAICEQQLGPDHLYLTMSLGGLAALYREQGKYEQAEPLLQRALAICEQQVGPDHYSTANCLQEMALLYREQGKFEQAESLLQRALLIRKEQLGPDHPLTAIPSR